MIELDKVLKPFAKSINHCYQSLYPDLPQYPQFSFSRAMMILWREKVYFKIKNKLLEAFVSLLDDKRNEEIKLGKRKTKESGIPSYMCDTPIENLMNCRKIELLIKFIQSVVDISVNELTIHYLGSTKAMLDDPYKELHRIIIIKTK